MTDRPNVLDALERAADTVENWASERCLFTSDGTTGDIERLEDEQQSDAALLRALREALAEIEVCDDAGDTIGLYAFKTQRLARLLSGAPRKE